MDGKDNTDSLSPAETTYVPFSATELYESVRNAASKTPAERHSGAVGTDKKDIDSAFSNHSSRDLIKRMGATAEQIKEIASDGACQQPRNSSLDKELGQAQPAFPRSEHGATLAEPKTSERDQDTRPVQKPIETALGAAQKAASVGAESALQMNRASEAVQQLARHALSEVQKNAKDTEARKAIEELSESIARKVVEALTEKSAKSLLQELGASIAKQVVQDLSDQGPGK